MDAAPDSTTVPTAPPSSGPHRAKAGRTRQVFWAGEIYQHTRDRKGPRRRVRRARRAFKPILRTYAGKAPRYKRTRGIARNYAELIRPRSPDRTDLRARDALAC